ncbi:hypothetical protein [Williamsia sp. CHRR-6]|uniref:hypothetical protein n=1 Tax=Williamsia sp. CHRR-6 TaxID=2835871 RepID=UPI001BD93349|nr:hypothetical protein [Williamsia sp. CHRR-6]MBT0565364.1 hypothetical protein [Williamsia sp. CHRR-6]
MTSVATNAAQFPGWTYFEPGEFPVGFRDPLSKCELIAATPASQPRLWRDYLDGARAVYRARGVEVALDHAAILDGHDTALFYAVLDADGVCGGVRIQGPYTAVDQSHAVGEWAGNHAQSAVVAAVDKRLAEGVAEVKTAWVAPRVCDGPAVSALLARQALASLGLLGTRYLMATAADYILRVWGSSGGRIDETVAPAAYPDERYRTRLMWWDRTEIESDADPGVWPQMCLEAEQLAPGMLTDAERVRACLRPRRVSRGEAAHA